ncbi:MAG: helix-turn-helix transcriptional regulator [Bacteroidales bacterium]|nr:helix-turn-helix transcriptional regulator [Bacteroidales bacterium]
MAGCSKLDRSEEANQLKQELQELLYKDPERALAQVDSAELVGLFSTPTANLIRTNLYGSMGQMRLALFYGEQILNVPELKKEGDTYYSALLLLNGLLERNGEYGKALSLSDEIFADVENGVSEPVALRVKSRALTSKGDCEKNLGHPDEAERYYLEGIDLMMDGVKHSDDYWVIDALFVAVLEATEFYLEVDRPEKALPLIAKGDTALARLDRCPNVPEYVHHLRHNNTTISQALIYAANGQRDKAEALYQRHRLADGLAVYDLVAEARYLAMTDRYDEAIRMFRRSDSLYLAQGRAITTAYIKNNMMSEYETLQKAGRKDEVLALSDRMRHLTDSIHVQERKIDVEQQQVIRQKETEIARRRQSIAIHRIILFAAILVILLIGCLLVRAYIYNKKLEAKNRSLYLEIQQREKAEAEEREALQEKPAETLSQSQLLYRRLCELMSSPDVFTNPDTNQDTLASLAGTNRTYIYDALRECAGVTPTDFINGYRLRYAARLLATSSDSVALIAELCGLSRRTFYRLFDEAYAMSPSDYRKAASK